MRSAINYDVHLTCLVSHLVLPRGFGFWIPGGKQFSISGGTACIVVSFDSAIGSAHNYSTPSAPGSD